MYMNVAEALGAAGGLPPWQHPKTVSRKDAGEVHHSVTPTLPSSDAARVSSVLHPSSSRLSDGQCAPSSLRRGSGSHNVHASVESAFVNVGQRLQVRRRTQCCVGMGEL